MRSDLRTICVLALGLAFVPIGDAAKADVLSGVLRCRVEGGFSYVVGSQRPLKCLYKPTNTRNPREYLIGTTNRLGLAIGFRFSGTLVWTVRSPIHDISSLAGVYSGVGADAKIFEGPNADILVGGENGRVALRPSTVGGPSGFEVSAGIGRLTLTRTQRSDLFEGLDDDDIE